MKRVINSRSLFLIKSRFYTHFHSAFTAYADLLISSAQTPFQYLKKLNDFQMLDVAKNITQDVLIIGAQEDHFVAVEL